jgi:hypothetical protein
MHLQYTTVGGHSPAWRFQTDWCLPGFTNQQLFDSIYRGLCEEALQLQKERPRFDIEVLSQAVVASMDADHKEQVDRTRAVWRQIRWSSLCCTCFWDRPAMLLKCGHGLCERDAWRHSHRKDAYGTESYFARCPACNASEDTKIRLRPLQAGYRVATFDGGGVMGIVPLVALQCILWYLPFGLQGHEYFDFVAGTSAGTILVIASGIKANWPTGSINAAALGVKQWPVRYCIKQYRSLAPRIFPEERSSVPARILSMWRGKYSDGSLQNVFREVYGLGPLRYARDQASTMMRTLITATGLDGRARLCRSYVPMSLDHSYLPPEGELAGQADLPGSLWRA